MAAIECRAIVCTAAPSMLDGKLDPRPSPERMRTIVRAANAPGVKLVVVLVPSGEHYAEEELVLKKDGKPYVILRCPPLVEELADEYNGKVEFRKLNTDDNPRTAAKYGIRSIPALLVFKGGEPVGQIIGFRPKSDLKKRLDDALA